MGKGQIHSISIWGFKWSARIGKQWTEDSDTPIRLPLSPEITPSPLIWTISEKSALFDVGLYKQNSIVVKVIIVKDLFQGISGQQIFQNH